MGSRGSVVRRGLGALAGLTLIGAMTAAAAVAGTADLALTDVKLGNTCFVGTPSGTGPAIEVKLVRDSVPLSTATIDSPTSAPEDVCFDTPILGGDHLVVTGGRDVALPHLRIKSIDRNGDRVIVNGDPSLALQLRTHRCALGAGFNVDFCPQKTSLALTLDAGGKRTVDLTSKQDLRGHDLVQVRFKPSPTELVRVTASVPDLFIHARSSSFQGVLPAGMTGTYQLRAKDGTVRATATLVGGPNLANTEWRKNGNPVTTRVGDRITGTVPANLSIKLPKGPTTVNAASDVLKGTCFSGGKVFIEHAVPEDVTLTAKPDGTFSVDLTSRGGIGGSGEQFEVTCVTKAYDLVEYVVIVP